MKRSHVFGAVTRMSQDQSGYAPSEVLQMSVWLLYRCLNGTMVHRWTFGWSWPVWPSNFK